MGLGKDLLLLQEDSDPVPLDYRDLVASYKQPSDVDQHIAEFVPRITEGLQRIRSRPDAAPVDFLGGLDLGAPAAENEATKLGHYYLRTDQFSRAAAGDARIITGRKGSGKTALFLSLRDRVRANGADVVLDLKPEGHQLKRFKDGVLNALGDAAREHLAAAFWEYVLMLELCHKLLELDRVRHLRDHALFRFVRPARRVESSGVSVEMADSAG